MDPAGQLARNLVREVEADGFTLAVWGGGSVLISQVAIATVHVVGSFRNVVPRYLFVRVAQSLALSTVVGAILVGTHVTITYNLGHRPSEPSGTVSNSASISRRRHRFRSLPSPNLSSQ